VALKGVSIAGERLRAAIDSPQVTRHYAPVIAEAQAAVEIRRLPLGLHVEEAQPRQPGFFQQGALQVLWSTSTGFAGGIWIEIGGGRRENAPIALT
jgi:hypothetical protein